MAKSTAEQFREVFEQLAILTERDATREREVEELKAVAEKERDERVRSQLESTAVRQQLHDHLAHYGEWDRRRWGLVVLLIGTVLSLASGLVVALAKR